MGELGVNGTVTEFDDPRGLGQISGDDGTSYPFHCIQIADGSRTIAVDAAVAFDVVPGTTGQWEAGNIRPRS
jgi:cold shock CspA family protein